MEPLVLLVSTRRSISSFFMASRTGVRDTSKASARSSSRRRVPMGSSPVAMASRTV